MQIIYAFLFQSIRWVTQCCYTTLVVHGPGYQNKIFMTFADAINFGETIPRDIQPVVRVQMKDYRKSKVAELLPFPGGKPVNSEVEDMEVLNDYGKFGTIQGFIDRYMEGKFFPLHDPVCNIGKTSQEHIDEDGNVIVIGLKEYDELL